MALHLQNSLGFPFRAKCIGRRQTSPVRPGQHVKVIGMADPDDCQAEIMVMIEWQDVELAVPLEQLQPINADEETTRAVEDWHYWLARGYRF
jgi:hypothetical protein